MPTDPEVTRRLTAVEQEVEDLAKPEITVDLIAPYLDSPVLRAFWPMSSVHVTPGTVAVDVSGQENHLGDAGQGGNVEFSYDTANVLAPIAIFNGGASDYLTLADAGAGDWADILGTEGYVRAAERGLTIGGWFWWSALPGAVEYLMAKDDGGANRQYRLIVTAGDLIQFEVWAGPVSVASGATINAGWNHAVGIYDQPSQTLFVVLNGVVTTGGVGAAPAVLADTAAAFTIGADGAGANPFTGYASGCSLNACSVATAKESAIRESTKAAYGVE